MKTAIKNLTTSVILLSILAALLGAVLVVYPDISLVALGIAVAAYLIIHGITLIILDIKAWRLYIPFDGMLLVPVADLGDTLVTQRNNSFPVRTFYRLYYTLKG